MIEMLFIGSVFMIFFAYFGYPFSLKLMESFRSLSVKKESFFPSVTFIITAYNEEKRIGRKLQETLALDYPGEKFQILVASDGSTDGTHDIVRAYEKDGVELLVMEARGGKENAQKEAVRHARGDIIVFSDVATSLDTHGIREIVANFADTSVGAVSSEDLVIDKDGTPCGEGMYVRYEMWLRRMESRVFSLVGLSGSFFAARKEICLEFPGDMQSDFWVLLRSIQLGYRGVIDSSAVGYYQDIADEKQEFQRKVRTVIRGITVFFNNSGFLNVFRYGFFSYQFFCHKLLRWLVPFFLIVALASNLILAASSTPYYVFLLCQAAFYSAAAWGNQTSRPFSNSFLKIPLYFLTVNLAILQAWWRYLNGQRIVMWKPSER